jgi:hypothetical protein
MATWTYVNIEPIVPNTVLEESYADGVFRGYRIGPNTGYVMHDVNYDTDRLGYRASAGTVGASYAWTPVEMLDEAGNTVTAYGDRQFFTKLATDVPADQIFATVTPPTETA